MNWFVGWANSQFCSAGTVELAESLEKRRQELIKASSPTAIPVFLETRRRLVISGSTPATFQNAGLAFDHTYGFPIIPAASLKGVVRHFLEEEFVWEKIHALKPEHWQPLAKEPAELAGVLFGRTEDKIHEGIIVFHDAWPRITKETRNILDRDVLTVHQQDYYAGVKNIADDTGAPVPVPFLCIAGGVLFRTWLALTAYGISLAADTRRCALALTRHLLKRAVRQWGIGARTGSGYGIMTYLDTEGSV